MWPFGQPKKIEGQRVWKVAVLGSIEQSKQDGVDAIGEYLDKMDWVIDAAPSTW